jgi:ribosome-binding ATPase YchF (GTP1/OBG family)
MKICALGIPGLKPGKHNLKDPRLDQAHQLVEADKKTYAQSDVLDPENALEADAIIASNETLPDLILKDLEFIETRLSRNPPETEKAVLEKLQAHLEQEGLVFNAGLNAEEREAIAAHRLHTNRAVVVASNEELAQPEALILKAVREGGYISFLTVGGKENRAWLIPQGATAWEAAGCIHSDIQKGFIRAEITSFEDFIQAGGETQAKRAGKLRLETKNYVVQDYDLVNFRFNK